MNLSVKMKLLKFLVTLAALCKVETISQSNDELRKAFVKVWETLAQRNHLVTIFVDGAPSDKFVPVLHEVSAGLPHVTQSFDPFEKK